MTAGDDDAPRDPRLDPQRAAMPLARRRPGLVALVYACRALAGLLIALPTAAALGSTTSGWPRGAAALFEPGGLMLVESLRLARRAMVPVGASSAAIVALALVTGVLPLGALLAGLGREGRLSVAFLAERAWAYAGTLALIFGLGALTQAAAGSLLVVLGGKLIGALKLAPPADDLAFVALLGAASALVLVLGALRDLVSVAAVRGERRFYDAVSGALRCARKTYGRALGAWAWRASLGLAGTALAAWLAPAGAATAAVVVAVVLHQAAIVGVTFARASWLAAAMRLYDTTEARAAGPEPEHGEGLNA